MKSRSPRVVSRPSTPWRGAPPGARHSRRPISAMQPKTKAKKASVAGVQAIQKPPKSGWVQEKPCGSCLPTLPQPALAWARPRRARAARGRGASRARIYTRPQGEALGDVVAHEIDHERAGDDGQARRRRRAGRARSRRSRRCGSSPRRSAWPRPRSGSWTSSISTQENMKQKKAATPMPALMFGNEDPEEEAREGVAVDIGGLVELLRHAGHEALEDPDRERDVEQAMRQRHARCGCRRARPRNRAGRTAARRPPAGAMRLVSSQKNRCLSPRKR